jgi:hypothetical protein
MVLANSSTDLGEDVRVPRIFGTPPTTVGARSCSLTRSVRDDQAKLSIIRERDGIVRSGQLVLT